MRDWTSPLDGYRARPGQTLAAHLHGVATNVDRLLPERTQTAWGDDWSTVERTLAWTHDAGKLTTWFDAYLDTDDRHVAPRPEYTYHGFVGALLSAHALYAVDVSDAARVAGFYAVAKHHGVVPNLQTAHEGYVGDAQRTTERFEVARNQLENIDEHAPEAAEYLLRRATAGELGWADVFIEDPTVYRQLLTPPPRRLGDDFYGTVLRAWSTLVCADKLDAAGLDVPADGPTRPSLDALRTHVAELPEGDDSTTRELNALRSESHDSAWRTLCDRYADGDRLFRLTLPTGFGKTLTGLRAGLELATRTDGRLIYALPYTSIIDQVDSECQDIFGVTPTDPAYTVHHHLADTRTDVEDRGDGDRINDGSESTFAETWQSGLVLTTFTQLFESTVGPANTQSTKLPALQDAVIVVDEPQAISLTWWLLVARVARFLTQEYDATLVLMTATQPKLLERAPGLPTPTPLTDGHEDCLEFLSEHPRVEFVLHGSLTGHLDGDRNTEPLPVETAADELLAATTPGTSTLAVLNTVESVATMAEAIADRSTSTYLAEHLLDFHRSWDGESVESADAPTVATAYLNYLADRQSSADGLIMATLTTRLRPRDRRILLAAVRSILDDETTTPFDDRPVVVVSTQLIEAGVDVSFDRLYRDVAPLTAIVQAAGRCNRSFGGGTGRVTVWRLAAPDESSQIPSELIYGNHSRLRPTRMALSAMRDGLDGADVLPESTIVSDGVNQYYEALHDQWRTGDRSDELVEAFETGNGERLRRASLVDEEYETQDIAILTTTADRALYERYREVKAAENWTEARETFQRIQSLCVSIPVDAGSADESTDRLVAVDCTRSDESYDITTGRGVNLTQSTMNLER